MKASNTHLVLIPSFDSGRLLPLTVSQVRAVWNPVWVVIDGSTDGSPELLKEMPGGDPGVRILRLASNQGKGAAIHCGLRAAEQAGYSHVLTMDADGQHCAERIASFMEASLEYPDAMILGVPVFGPEAPALRVRGRRISNAWVQIETLWAGVADSLFGFRVYPIQPLLTIMDGTRWMRRFDFDPEAVVRLSWAGVPAVNLPAPVRYLSPDEGGVSHFNYWRDNLLLTGMHIRLMLEWLVRWPLLWRRRSARASGRTGWIRRTPPERPPSNR